jgi:ankyrin repeat protein
MTSQIDGVHRPHSFAFRLLLELGADPEVTSDGDGTTPFVRAAMFGRTEAMQQLLDHQDREGRLPDYD